MAEETYSMMPGEGGGQIKGLDMEFKTIQETMGKYELKDGTVLEVKLIPLKAVRGYDENDADDIARKADGEPVYSLRFHAAVTAKVQDALLKKA